MNSSSITIPNPSAKLEVSERSRKVAIQVSDRIGVDELSLLLMQTHHDYARDDPQVDEEGQVETLSLWYAEETLAVPQIVLELYRLAGSGLEEWSDVAVELRDLAVGSESGYVEGLFRAFSGMAQKQLEGKNRMEDPMFW